MQKLQSFDRIRIDYERSRMSKKMKILGVGR